MRKRGRPRPDALAPLDLGSLAPLKIDIEPLKVELPELNLDALDIRPLALDELPELPDIKLEPLNLDIVEPLDLELPELDLKLDELPGLNLDELPGPLALPPPRPARKGRKRPR